MGKRFIECCCTSPYEVAEAAAGGASRAELCERLDVGGVTPSEENIRESLKLGIPVNVLVRAREGDFCYNEAEVAEMEGSIRLCRELGVNAVVIGALDADGNVDMPVMRRLMAAAGDMPVTFHRAFDECADPVKAFDDILDLAPARLLTSGHAADALSGASFIAELVAKSEGKIVIMPGKGVRPSNISEIEKISRAMEFHSSAHGPDGRTDRRVVSQLVDDPLEVLTK